MAKVALLIGVSQYQVGFSPLPKAKQDVAAMQIALQDHSTEGFDQIQVLLDPDVQTMRVKIESLFSDRSKEDLMVLFFSGHGIKDDWGKLYFASQDTRKSTSGELIRATAVSASFVQELMSQSRCKRQVVILDCCFSGAFALGMEAKDSGIVDIETQLGGEGRAVLTSSTSTQYSFEEQSADLSIYTRYLVEGLETGAADLDHDGWIEVEELHDYAKSKVQATAPAMKPEIYAVKEGFKIRLVRARIGDPKLLYRQEAERYADRGEISGVSRIILNTLREQLALSAEKATQIEEELLRPYRERLENLQRYREAVLTAVKLGYPFSEQTRNDLNHFQDILGLRDEDIAQIAAEIKASMENREQQLVQHQQTTEEPTPPSETVSPQVPLQYRVETIAPQTKPEASPVSPPTINVSNGDALSSEQFGDNSYAKLRDLLALKAWKAADMETAKLMLKAVNKESQRFLRLEDINNFPCEDLQIIDQLWVQYSGGNFGFSVQKDIYSSLCSSLGGVNNEGFVRSAILFAKFANQWGRWQKFIKRVGWKDIQRIGRSEEFKGVLPLGHLPSIIWWTRIGDLWRNRQLFNLVGSGLIISLSVFLAILAYGFCQLCYEWFGYDSVCLNIFSTSDCSTTAVVWGFIGFVFLADVFYIFVEWRLYQAYRVWEVLLSRLRN
ncbi:MAG: GUN4 domain-containing protein [Pseudanabaenales cyanobacterium]|nr:GUN4 domain-containing protein [Pseudanabaenales cyanobacterium]